MQPVTEIKDIVRPPRELCDALAKIGTATASSELNLLGLRDPHIRGPRPLKGGRSVAGPALTLQFMPKREDLYGEGEYKDVEKQLHRHVLYHVERGDMVVVDARADMRSGVFGEMMMTYFKGQGGAGMVIDGCLRDWPNIAKLGVPLWIRGVTPNFHTQTDLMPFAVNGPIACGGVTVIPGDIVVADDDGAVVVPAGLAEAVVAKARKDHEWEDFSREMLARGGDLRRYYPLSDAARPEYEAWKAQRARRDPSG